MRRTARGYDGIEPTSMKICEVLPEVLQRIGRKYNDRPDLVLAAWPELIGESLAKMTEAIAFDEGLLEVNVKNSTLHSLLAQHERPRLLQALRLRFPRITIRNIVFRIS